MNNIPSLVQIIAWRQPGDKPLSLPMMVSLLMLYSSLSLNDLIDGFVQERRNSSALAMELRLSCTNPSI